ncbi:MAG: LamB/YcsF family protein [Gemmatimonadales bacterium]
MDRVDLNCDLGEGAGADDEILSYVTSANIACGFHAGGPSIMRRTVRAALQHRVAIGAHPGLPDRENFGRVPQAISPDDAFDMVVYQVGALDGFVRALGADATMVHVKPHGALYNMAAADAGLADAIARAVRAVNPALVLIGLSGSELIGAGARAGLATANEVFADRSYQPDGTLTPRGRPGALLTDVALVVRQAMDLVRTQHVLATDGTNVAVRADTICLHGDGARAVEFARAIRSELAAAGIAIAPLARQR